VKCRRLVTRSSDGPPVQLAHLGSAPAKSCAVSFDHLVAGVERGRDGEAERFGDISVHSQRELGWLNERHSRWDLTLRMRLMRAAASEETSRRSGAYSISPLTVIEPSVHQRRRATPGRPPSHARATESDSDCVTRWCEATRYRPTNIEGAPMLMRSPLAREPPRALPARPHEGNVIPTAFISDRRAPSRGGRLR